MKLRWKLIDERVAARVRDLFRQQGKALRILDVGCGRGELWGKVKPFARDYVGIDASDKMLPSWKKAGDTRRFIRAEAEKLPKTLREFDVAVYKESLDHCYDPGLALKNTCFALKKGGKIMVTLNNHSSYYKRMFSGHTGNLERRQADHFHFFDIPSLGRHLEQQGYRVVYWQTFHYLRLPLAVENILGKIFPEVVNKGLIAFFDLCGRAVMPRSGGALIVEGEKK